MKNIGFGVHYKFFYGVYFFFLSSGMDFLMCVFFFYFYRSVIDGIRKLSVKKNGKNRRERKKERERVNIVSD